MQTKIPSFLKTRKVQLAAIVVLFCLTGFLSCSVGRLTATRQIANNANVVSTVNLSVYYPNGTSLTNIDWGIMFPTQTVNYVMYVQNDAQIPLNISLTTSDWTPDWAQGNLTFAYAQNNASNPLTWADLNLGDYPILNPGKRAPLYLTLTADANSPSGTFGFTITIRGDST